MSTPWNASHIATMSTHEGAQVAGRLLDAALVQGGLGEHLRLVAVEADGAYRLVVLTKTDGAEDFSDGVAEQALQAHEERQRAQAAYAEQIRGWAVERIASVNKAIADAVALTNERVASANKAISDGVAQANRNISEANDKARAISDGVAQANRNISEANDKARAHLAEAKEVAALARACQREGLLPSLPAMPVSPPVAVTFGPGSVVVNLPEAKPAEITVPVTVNVPPAKIVDRELRLMRNLNGDITGGTSVETERTPADEPEPAQASS